jgi:hypothetical protein
MIFVSLSRAILSILRNLVSKKLSLVPLGDIDYLGPFYGTLPACPAADLQRSVFLLALLRSVTVFDKIRLFFCNLSVYCKTSTLYGLSRNTLNFFRLFQLK